jgi:uncharacterized protein (TIGR03435 family)
MCYLNNTTRAASLALLLSTAGAGQVPQTAGAPAAFDVVSIKPNRSGSLARAIGPQPGGFGGLNVTARELIAYAYGVPQNQAAQLVDGGPDWLGSDRFNVDARVNGPRLAPEQFPPLIQRLLADRFHLVAHRETRPIPVFALVAIPDASERTRKLRRNTAVDCEARRAAARAAGGPPPLTGSGAAAADRLTCALRIFPGEMHGDAVSMSMLAGYLDAFAGRTVVDRTGLNGYYDVDLVWTPDAPAPGTPVRRPPDAPPVDPNGPSFFTALEEQLGVKLQSETAPMSELVIDSIDRPEEN